VFQVTLFYTRKNAWSALWREGGYQVLLHQQFGVSGYSLAYLQKCMVSNIVASAILSIRLPTSAAAKARIQQF